MNRETIIKLAKECDLVGNVEQGIYLMALERFAELVAEHEREACAKVVEAGVLGHGECAAAIRARGDNA